MERNKIFKGEKLSISGTLALNGVGTSSEKVQLRVMRNKKLIKTLDMSVDSSGAYKLDLDTDELSGHLFLRFVVVKSDGSIVVANDELELEILE